jgi:hypothetical protein
MREAENGLTRNHGPWRSGGRVVADQCPTALAMVGVAAIAAGESASGKTRQSRVRALIRASVAADAVSATGIVYLTVNAREFTP